MDLSELLEARHGRPTEDQAARKIATFAVIPAAIVGLLAGTQLVGVADPIGRLLWVCTATAFGSGFGIAFLGWQDTGAMHFKRRDSLEKVRWWMSLRSRPA